MYDSNDSQGSNMPEGGIVREDGCVCPKPPAKKECEFRGFQTCPYDPRFPNTNQTKRCYLSFIDYQRCARLLGDYPGCQYFLRCYRALCPNAWQDKWFDQMENGTFPRKIYPPKPIIRPNIKEDLCQDENLDEPAPIDVC